MSGPSESEAPSSPPEAAASDAQRGAESMAASEHPEAAIRPARNWRSVAGWWWLPAVCAILAIVLLWSARRSTGPQIVIQFRDGHGIEPGDVLRHRGIEVGEVTQVKLTDDLGGVAVSIRLESAAALLAVEGSRFWIERPQLSLARVRSLETVVGPKFVAVAPGPADAPPRSEFVGEDNPLTVVDARVEEIVIRFAAGHGLAVGDELRHRGIRVGEVTSVELAENLGTVKVHVRLSSSASGLARVGSQFWIERPDIGFQGIRGLDTVIGGRYLAVLPGPIDAAALTEFVGRENPPVLIDRAAGGLEIVLESAQRLGVEAGSPITYRGVQVGTVLSVSLAADAATVEVRGFIFPDYRLLVRANTTFWSTSGFDVHLGVSGLDVTADTLATVLSGGIAMATPNDAGATVATGHRFTLNPRPEDEQERLAWQPRLPIGSGMLPDGAVVPRPHRALMRWYKRALGFRRQQEHEGWLLHLENNTLLGPADLLELPESADEGKGVLELEGRKIPLPASGTVSAGALAVVALPAETEPPGTGWPLSAMRVPANLEDVLVVGGDPRRSMPLAAARMNVDEGRWLIDPSLPIDADAHGACVISTHDGALVGLLLVRKSRPFVAPLSDRLVKPEP